MITLLYSLKHAGRSFGLLSIGFLSALGAMSLTHVSPAQAQSPGVNLAALVAQVNALQTKLSAEDALIHAQAATIAAMQHELASSESEIDTLKNGQGANAAAIAALQGDVNAQSSDLGALQAVTASMRVSGSDLIFTGVNVHIVSGSGATNDFGRPTGLGNLIVGYNAKSPYAAQTRTGSHNLILGDANNYLSYGGIVAGANNTSGAPYASVTGGSQNVASGRYATVTGGYTNTASANCASVSGGDYNMADGVFASVSGGYHNSASADEASVSGGIGNKAGDEGASVSGGVGNRAISFGASVSGGSGSTAYGRQAPMSGSIGDKSDLENAWSTVSCVTLHASIAAH
ncbi:MAG: hypothetical protein ABIY70_17170 [Capsulimonas sp.]|uniref:hypothetical protein n=1 Tax=Capsulimonas sp. TaxID=2494211 RepID=UPI003265BE1D